MKRFVVLILTGIVILQMKSPVLAQQATGDYVQYANILQGTDSHLKLSRGNTIPCVVMPHGVHAWSAQTGEKGTGQKYEYRADRIVGFDQTHQCNSWMNDYAVFALMPEVGTLVLDERERGARFSHSNEHGQPNYYSVKFDNGIRTEIAPTERCAHLRFSFPATGDAYLVLDGNVGTSRMEIDPQAREIRGWVKNMPWGSPGINAAKDSLCEYFILRFDRPFAEWGLWEGVHHSSQAGETIGEGERVGAWIRFRRGSKVQVKVAGSFISPGQAQVNFDREIAGDRNLEVTKARGADVWNGLFGRMKVEGGTEEELRTFYSCLFRASCFPRIFYDIREDGSPYYRSPYDGKVHEGYMFADNGLWDSFRSHMPLNVLFFPTYQGRYVCSLMDAREQGGWFPAWSAPGETGVMIGNHAITVLADAWAKGIQTFDPEAALEAYFYEATHGSRFGGSVGRSEHADYFSLGYIPFRSAIGAVARTLEYCFDDFCGFELARRTGNIFYEGVFRRQVFNYKNVFDPSDGFMKGRNANGSFDDTFNPYRWGSMFAPGDYVEGNAWHWTWSVFHDVNGLIDLFGSKEAFAAKMDSVFILPQTVDFSEYGVIQHEMAEMLEMDMGQYCHGNQPIQHMPYLYCYAGQPWKTQYHVREICRRMYSSSPAGYPGDEDQGSTSAWYVWSAMGMFPVTPGVDQYVIGSPVFGKMTLTLENGNQFVVEAEGNSPENVYIQSATLNGTVLDRNYLYHSEVVQGGILHLVMGPEPNEERGIGLSAAPFSVSNEGRIGGTAQGLTYRP